MKKYFKSIILLLFFYFLSHLYVYSDDLLKKEICNDINISKKNVKERFNNKIKNSIFLNDIKLDCNLNTLIYLKTLKLEKFDFTKEVIINLQNQHNFNNCKTELIKVYNFTIIDLIYYEDELMFFLTTKPSDCKF